MEWSIEEYRRMERRVCARALVGLDAWRKQSDRKRTN
jgi:hypothetical protein